MNSTGAGRLNAIRAQASCSVLRFGSFPAASKLELPPHNARASAPQSVPKNNPRKFLNGLEF